VHKYGSEDTYVSCELWTVKWCDIIAEKMGDWRFNANGKQRNCSVRDGLVFWERKCVFPEDMLTRNETE
jgi:hypothetical protein